ncbi:MAG: UDP-N-acetylmuramoyl-tripeptide--D-alanyl-D-alanine ligase [Gammaproteobacteria bacterium]|nr:UDP-N-acetylmuramoyl-tripeptide--D-alanyl-D-alanine ligase [Gammaproteobacteria bacterium]
MISLRLSQLCLQLEAELFGEDRAFSSVSTDTRSIAPGDLFVALKGPKFDGHDYVQKAVDSGAAAVMVSNPAPVGVAGLMVRDTRVGLGRLAKLWRELSHVQLIGVTGSNGKTTVKEMIAAILCRRGRVLATRGNYNNDVGLPLTLLRLQDEDFAVVEMGANNPGEIAYLSSIATPDIALITNAGRAHLEGFGTLEGVARAKSEILDGLKPGGCFILNADDPWADLWRQRVGTRRVKTFGMDNPADVTSPKSALKLQWNESGFVCRFPVSTPNGGGEIRLRLAGNHNRMNALAAIAAAQAAGAEWEDIAAGLAALEPVPGRLQPLPGRNGAGLINDSYNANPDSVKAAIDLLASAPGRRYLVLGELAEMGADAASFYREIGNYANNSGIDKVYTLNAAVEAVAMLGHKGERFTSLPQLIDRLGAELQPGDRVLVKGSRVAAMERVVAALGAGGGH